MKPLPAATIPTSSVATLPNTIILFGSMSVLDRVLFAYKTTIEKVRKLITGKTEYLDAVVKVMKEKMEANGANLDANPQVKHVLNDLAFLIETIKKHIICRL